MTLMSMMATILYGGVAVLLIHASRVSVRMDHTRADSREWIVAAAFFLILVAMRLVEAEEWTRQLLREWLRQEGGYEARRTIQGPLVAATLIMGTLGAGYAWRSWPGLHSGKGRLLLWTIRQVMLGFLVLIALRVVSLHAVDALLYSPPLRLNWLLDGGLTVTAGAAALIYARHYSANAGQFRPGRGRDDRR